MTSMAERSIEGKAALHQPSRERLWRPLRTLAAHFLLAVGALFFVVPLLFMISTSLKATRQIAQFPRN